MGQGLRRRLEGVGPCELRTAGSIGVADVAWMCARRLVFVRSRSVRLLELLERVEQRGVRVVNAPASIRAARHRHGALARIAERGIPTPRDYEGPLSGVPFARSVVKSRHDRGQGAPSLHEGPSTERRVVYAQEHLPGAWEHKLYLVGDETFAFTQRPTLVDPEKLATRRRVTVDPHLARLARGAADALGLEVAGVDFLEDAAGVPRVTDVNSNQGLHTFAEGQEALARFLLARRG